MKNKADAVRNPYPAPGIVLGVSMTWGQADPKENKLLLSQA